MNIQDLCEALRRGTTLTTQIFLRPGFPIQVDIETKPKLTLTLLGAKEDCFKLIIDLKKKFSELEYLLLTARDNCPGKNVKQLGTLLLDFVDRVNECLELEVCKLYNVAYFDSALGRENADCAYSRTHHGLGFYMSRGYLIAQPNYFRPEVDLSILRTNLKIEADNGMWNTLEADETMRRDHDSFRWCDENVKDWPVLNMVKFYNKDIQVYTPKNPLAPAMFYRGTLDQQRLNRLETFDYVLGAKLLVKYIDGLNHMSFDELFSILRQVYPAPPDFVIAKKVRDDMAKEVEETKTS